MTALVGFPLETIYEIVAISRGYPGVVTLATIADPNAFAVATGQTVTISKVIGMHEINGQRFIIGCFDPETLTFSLYSLKFLPVDTSGYSDYIAGGEINIISYVPPAGQPPGLMYNNQ